MSKIASFFGGDGAVPPAAASARIGLIAAHPGTHSPTAVYARELGTALRQLPSRPDIFPVLAAPCGRLASERAIITLNDAASYDRALAALASAGLDALLLQHDFESLPVRGSEHLLSLLEAVRVPIITTLHDVPTHPTPEELALIQGIGRTTSAFVVVARKAAEILHDTFEIPTAQIEVIRGGVHFGGAVPATLAKARLGLAGRNVIMTAGLLSHDMGVEVLLEAMPGLVERHPRLVYFVLGETHPRLLEREGESYRCYLEQRAAELGVSENFRLCGDHRYGTALRDTLAATDIYVSPYLSEAVAASQTLTSAVAAGRPVLATPSWYASELLSAGQGELVPFGSPSAFAAAIDGLLANPRRMRLMRRQALESAKQMQWSRVAERYGGLLFGGAQPGSPVARGVALPVAEFGMGGSAARLSD